ncbi:dienelactone hydrolase family protein [Silvibacterium dinghuense]|uniref:dienelactone hydrolase family protein n=1 Tax=Silvibacterium dinghuense TaxID=1560006 RepID=UPI0013E97632|nr:dienelactone hydrolase family protein [Silvibacterium dinghuense]
MIDQTLETLLNIIGAMSVFMSTRLLLNFNGRIGRMRLLFGLVVLLITGVSISALAETAFQFTGAPGPYSVGFRAVIEHDSSRTYGPRFDSMGAPVTDNRARPIQTLIWYPAVKSKADHMNYGNYLDLFASEEGAPATAAQAEQTVLTRKKDYTADADPTSQMRATNEAKPDEGKYPLVIYAPSYGGPAFENADLCEYLASYGYVVIASPSIGAHSFNMIGGIEGAELQARDISFLIGFAQTLRNVDLSHIAVIGYSWGGLSNFFAAAQDDRIGALIALDGSARYFPKLIKDSKYVQPQNMTIPLLFFTRGEIPLESLTGADMSGNVLNEMVHSDVYIVRMHDMRHGEFSSMHQRSPAYWLRHPPEEYSQQETSKSYEWIARYTLNFLNLTLKNDIAGKAFLIAAPAKNGVSDHMLAVDFRPAKENPTSPKP